MNIRDAVRKYLSQNPSEGKTTAEIIKDLASKRQFKGAKHETLRRSVQIVRNEAQAGGSGVRTATSDHWWKFDENTQKYDIQAGPFRFQDVPAAVVQDWVSWYTTGGSNMTQAEVSRQSFAVHSRPLTKKQFQNLVKALDINKGSLPLAPHLVSEDAEAALSMVREAQEAAIEMKMRARDARYWRKAYEELVRDRNFIERLGDRIAGEVAAGSPVSAPAVSYNHDLSSYQAVLFLSDWHVGQAFDTPVGRYDKEVFQDRLHHLLQECSDWLRAYKRPLDHLHIALGGDMVDGVLPMRPQHSLQQDLHEGEQVQRASDALEVLIKSLWQRAGAPCTVWSVGGNHDRAGGARTYDPNRTVAQWLTQVTRAKLPREITWNHTSEGVNAWRVYDTMVLLTHGDNTPKDPRDMVHPYRRSDVRNYLVLTGHLHSGANEDGDITWVRCGSMVGYDPYAASRFGAASRPSQVLVEVRREGGPRQGMTLLV